MKNKLFETNTLKINDLMLLGEKYLLDHNITNSKKEIEWFIVDQFQLNIYDIKLNKNHLISQLNKNHFIDFIHQRSKGKPFQYIINKCSFYGYDFYVNSETLIPRPETELIVEIAQKKETIFCKCLDIGTGSGNLALTLRLKNIAESVDAIDISKKALSVAKKNQKIYNIDKVLFKKIDVLKFKFDYKYDLIVSNPPYITKKDYNNLPDEIKKYEPAIALTDFDEGLIFYKKIHKHLPYFLKKNGILLIEIGLTHTKKTIDSIFRNSAYQLLWHKDLNGDYRVLEVKKIV